MEVAADRIKLPCRHVFHASCIDLLRNKSISQKCPCCRAPLPPPSQKAKLLTLLERVRLAYKTYIYVSSGLPFSPGTVLSSASDALSKLASAVKYLDLGARPKANIPLACLVLAHVNAEGVAGVDLCVPRAKSLYWRTVSGFLEAGETEKVESSMISLSELLESTGSKAASGVLFKDVRRLQSWRTGRPFPYPVAHLRNLSPSAMRRHLTGLQDAVDVLRNSVKVRETINATDAFEVLMAREALAFLLDDACALGMAWGEKRKEWSGEAADVFEKIWGSGDHDVKRLKKGRQMRS